VAVHDCPPEQAAYLPVDGAQMYTVLHPAAGEVRGRVLLAGPFPSQRLYTYVPWVSWARLLACNGYEVLRFDYRGTGESTGRFEEMTFALWLDDLRIALEHLRRRGEQPTLIHGLLMGGLLGSLCFKEKRGDGLLLWEPVKSAEKMLKDMLRGKLSEDMALGIEGQRKNREAYIRDMMSGGTVEVDGYAWTRTLWESSEGFALDLPDDERDDRPWQHIHLVRSAKQRSLEDEREWKIPIGSPPFWVNNQYMVPQLSDLFEQSLCAVHALAEGAADSRSSEDPGDA
jgi:pimeloyl-ACP methyl ester carboxylesterase